MSRAAVLIGVNRTGGLPRLSDAVTSVRLMGDWALAQGMPHEQVLLFTDEQQAVDVADIRKAIHKLVNRGDIEQLIIYFAGHGVNIRYGEYWLLSDAPIDGSAAVNVEGSIVLARRSGIPHVVFISDACRTAAEGIQAQGITGSEIFPNDPVTGPEQSVDIFFGTTLGRPALEIKDPTESSAAFKAVYTRALLEGLTGKLSEAVTTATLEGHSKYLVRPRPLKACLARALSKSIITLGVSPSVIQIPDARITSDDNAWLSNFDSVPQPLVEELRYQAAFAKAEAEAERKDKEPCEQNARRVEKERAKQAGLAEAQAKAEAEAERRDKEAREQNARRISQQTVTFRWFPQKVNESPQERSDAFLSSLLSDRNGIPNINEVTIRGTKRRSLKDSALTSGQFAPFGPMHFETQCGFKLRGAELAECVNLDLGIDIFPNDRSVARINMSFPAATVLLVLTDDSGILLPAVRGFITSLTIEEGELADVSYEPSDDTSRWQEFVGRAADLRALRGVIAGAARNGVFRLDGEKATALAKRMHYARHVDPSLALYSAYAYHDIQMPQRIREMSNALNDELGFSFYDLELLSGAFEPNSTSSKSCCYPPIPLLSQGWSLLSAHNVTLPGELHGIQRELLPSLWTHFNAVGTNRLRDLMLARKLK